ncbi:C40 family peptidase [Arcobacter arenosus]|uniref:NlpC/P60 family protein n=1 Tax=Arcobacter arenosus TaxID=2576037 RepID=A0A5R8Y6A8_9BACT|nr:C40 family peptidase [Arcobacter arenosus]TLP41032.1 NlpC/P60 family protein [Arcobacter arenosus]
MYNLEKLLDIPFVDNGRDFNGVDCYGLLMLYYKEILGIDVPDTKITAYQPNRTMAMYLDYVSRNWNEIKTPKKHCGVALSLNQNHPKLVTHFAVAIDEKRAIHTVKGKNTHIIDMDSPMFKPFIKGFYEWHN